MSGSDRVQQLSQRAQQSLGLPEGWKAWTSFPFKGMNQEDSRLAMDDAEFYWQENFLITGNGALRTLWDAGSALYTASGATIVYFFWFNIGPKYYCAVFLSDGTAVQVDTSGSVTNISAAAGTFYNSANGQKPACCQSGAQYLLIGNNNTPNDYWIWDGSNLYSSGSIGPVQLSAITAGGSGYNSVPTYVVYGGSGSGVVLTPVIAEGSVVALDVVSPGSGYLPGETPQVAFSGGGTDSTPILRATLDNNPVSFITLLSGGSSYTNGNFALGFSGGGGSGATGVFTVSGGVVTSVSITAGGSNYTASPTVSFSASSGGSGATAVAALSAGAVGAIFVDASGSGFSGTPTITITGGGGTGATAVASMNAGGISSVAVTNGGSGYTSAPSVQVQTGVNNSAYAILDLMPFGVSGTSIENFTSRVWLSYPNQSGKVQNGGVFNVSAPESLTDFSTTNGGLLYTSQDRYLRAQYTLMRQSNGYLYAFGDSSVSVISNVQTSGSPTATTFNYQNVDPQLGAEWRDTAQDFSRTILFASPTGVYGLYGGAVARVSKKINNLFASAVFPPTGNAVSPSSAVVSLYTIRCYLILMTIVDPRTNQQRNVMLGWDETRWFVASQKVALTFIGTQEIDSGLTAWGTDGSKLYPLFQTPSGTLAKSIWTKQWGGTTDFIVNEAMAVYLRASDLSAAQAGIVATVNIDAAGMASVTTPAGVQTPLASGVYPLSTQPNFLAPNGSSAVWGTMVQVPGTALGLDISTSSPDFLLQNITLGYIPISSIFG